MSEEKKLYVVGVRWDTLIVSRCKKCGEQTIQGFWNQIRSNVMVIRPQKRAVAWFECRECGHRQCKVYRLTSSPHGRRRFVDWIRLGFRVLPWVPKRYFQAFLKAILWLELNVRF